MANKAAEDQRLTVNELGAKSRLAEVGRPAGKVSRDDLLHEPIYISNEVIFKGTSGTSAINWDLAIADTISKMKSSGGKAAVAA